jgi:hypothetical protein
LQKVSTIRKHVLHLSTAIDSPNTDEIVAIIPHFDCSLGDTGDIAVLQAVDEVAGAALSIEDRENLPCRRS